ncbi:MAG: DUF433 domain-containing protein [bacterium]
MPDKHTDIRYTPLYRLPEVAMYTHGNLSTLRTWVMGRSHATKDGQKYQPVIKVEQPNRADALSFINLIESHVLVALRRTHQVPLPKIRDAVLWLQQETGSEHPLAELQIETDGLNVFFRHLNQIISASEKGQVVIRDVMERYLRRIERDAKGIPISFCPFTLSDPLRDSQTDIIMDPAVAFGRPVIRGTRIATATILERYKAGEGLTDLSKDYDLEMRLIEEALRCAIDQQAA